MAKGDKPNKQKRQPQQDKAQELREQGKVNLGKSDWGSDAKSSGTHKKTF